MIALYLVILSRGQPKSPRLFLWSAGLLWRVGKMNIVLIGYRCSGKTAAGTILARRLARDFLDTDGLIEQEAGEPLENLIVAKGWNQFREMERSVIATVSTRDNLVIATGGGVVMDERNVQRLKGNGLLVWLTASTVALKERMVKEISLGRIRPSITGADPVDEIDDVLKLRAPFYKRASHLAVDTTKHDPQGVAQIIIAGLWQRVQRNDKEIR